MTDQRGSANSTLALVRSLGMKIGITIIGTIQSNIFTKRMTGYLLGRVMLQEGQGVIRVRCFSGSVAKIPAPN